VGGATTERAARRDSAARLRAQRGPGRFLRRPGRGPLRKGRGRPDLVEAIVGATKRGYEFTSHQTTRTLNDLLTADPSLDKLDQKERLSEVEPYMQVEQFKPSNLREWATWDLKNGILKRPLDVEKAFAFQN
jgi:hypothetical protein